jgi:hypothetical protein
MISFIAVLVAVVTIPVALYTAVRAVNSLMAGTSRGLESDPALEARLERMEQAIDAMALQVERLRASSDARYVAEGVEVPRRLPALNDPDLSE